jgi:hypothetical protein
LLPRPPFPHFFITYYLPPFQPTTNKKDDKMLMVWDLRPNVDISSAPLSPSPPSHRARSNDSQTGGDNGNARPQPTAYVISFPHALSSVCAHATTTKDLLVADIRGSLALIDWRTDASHASTDAAWHHPRVVEFTAPRAIAGGACAFPASAAWQQANPDMYVTSSPPPLLPPRALHSF